MDIILLVDYDGLGKAGDLINVKSGFARNKLIPKGIALRASKQNISIVKEKNKNIERQKNKESVKYDILLKKLSKTEITIKAQVGKEDKMFGSITSIDIQKALELEGLNIDRNAIVLESPIKALGIYHIAIQLAESFASEVKLYVIKS
ncbi:MAG: 50S ribosomal protein L9 [Candidatus Marinimicrobia bacterium]|nr:50S ribosomal protein L9 [Candidatus Neomarinimicrobiota bacterium]|tara:strand:+ start:14969 stop:15412 length:444 start_codon:yes stop_codon:yes gene_type:complete